MAKLFKKVEESQRRDKTLRFRVSAKEEFDIQTQADLSKLDVSEYLRRVSLRRRADVHIEIDMIIALRGAVSEIRQLHATCLQQGLPPPEKELKKLLVKCENAIMSLSNY